MSDRGVDEDKRETLRRFAAFGAATPLMGLSTGDSEPRTAIVGYLTRTPGAHFSKLRDDLSLGTGETQHHLDWLLADGAIESRRDGNYKRFYPAGQFSEFEQAILGYLRRDTPRGILLALLRNPSATGSDVATELDVSGATVSTYARELAAAGVLDDEGGYTVADPEAVLALVIRYADSFGPDAVAFAADAADYIRFDPT